MNAEMKTNIPNESTTTKDLQKAPFNDKFRHLLFFKLPKKIISASWLSRPVCCLAVDIARRPSSLLESFHLYLPAPLLCRCC